MARKEEKKQGRGKEPNTLTKLMLVAKSGGRCQFDGCNKQLFVDEITLGKLNNSNIAHIVAASPDGPRGNEQSFELSNKLENLMLLCQEHHTLIDANPEEYTIEYLKKMKKAQEIRVESMLNGMDYPETEIIMFESPIKNMSDVRIDFLQAVETIRYYGKNPASKYGNLIRIECFEDYNSKEYWKSVEKRLEDCVRIQVQMMYQYNHDVKVDIFALAPIPLIIKLGSLLGDKKYRDSSKDTYTRYVDLAISRTD